MLSKTKNAVSFEEREGFDLNQENDRRVIREFEKEFEPFMGKYESVMPGTIYARQIFGFEFYLMKKGIITISATYPLGAIRDVEKYKLEIMKHSALMNLLSRRKWADRKDREQRESL